MKIINLLRLFTRPAWRLVERLALIAIWPLNQVLEVVLAGRVEPNSVLHICYPVHIVHYTVELLRQQGYKADYMALGDSLDWTKVDYRFQRYAKWLPLTLSEFWCFWRIVSRYQTVHLHFMTGVSETGWEWPILKRMGRKIVIYYSGCEIRDPDLNRKLHPKMNICQICDYKEDKCRNPINDRLRRLCCKYADLELVTTPDLRDFVPHAIHFPFFTPPEEIIPKRSRPYWPENKTFRIVHVTNHPGIEGTIRIEEAINNLKEKGYSIEFVFLKRMPYFRVLHEIANADLAIGKMKMGYYANAQIEAMCCSTPTITHVRDEYMTEELNESGLIFSSVDTIQDTIEQLIKDPEGLVDRRSMTRTSIQKFHNNTELCDRLIAMYEALNAGKNHDEVSEMMRHGVFNTSHEVGTS